MTVTKFLMMLLALFLVACSKGGDERLIEKIGLETESQIAAQNSSNFARGKEVQGDLDRLQTFVRAVEGEYKGDLKLEGIDYKLKVKLIPTRPLTEYSRNRTLEEVLFDYQNLNLTIHIKQWNPKTPLSAVSCVLENFRPDIRKGNFKVITEKCKNIYEFFVTETEPALDGQREEDSSSFAAQSVQDGKLSKIDYLIGKFESAISANAVVFKLTREEE
ncbi:MAG TPA: hypothetical protein DCY86_13855 [Bdellovibrionales bacterium]|nr:hypothetical protein [Bdellovibrionales bacterium]